MVDKALELVPAQVVLLGLLFLRGPQTLNELLTCKIKELGMKIDGDEDEGDEA